MLSNEERNRFATSKVLFVCEGSCERVIIETLLREGRLIVDESDAISDNFDRPTTNIRKASTIEETFLMFDYEQPVLIARILDSLGEKFKLSYPFETSTSVMDFHTRPEIEMLAIIKEGAEQDYLHRKKSAMKPSEYCKKVLGLTHIKQEDFLQRYWADPDELCECIRSYAHSHKMEKDEHSLADLLR
ncbi:MAG: hypothetical protein PUF51_07615 [Bifidobacteriaceae bacterium]|nr:hypothetical protein [Bifidobacteriaceae bacterium]